MKTAQIEFNRLAAQSKFDERAADIALISGGQWTRERQIAAGYACSPLRPRRKEQPETLAHRVWLCPANCGHGEFIENGVFDPPGPRGLLGPTGVVAQG
eukprot:8755337-Pyramimonas_sp.AAC.1